MIMDCAKYVGQCVCGREHTLETLKVVVRQPLVATETEGRFDILVNVKGGGFTGTVLGFSGEITPVEKFRPSHCLNGGPILESGSLNAEKHLFVQRQIAATHFAVGGRNFFKNFRMGNIRLNKEFS